MAVMSAFAVAAIGMRAAAQAPAATPVAAPAAAANSICGNQPLCYEASDFAATITDFRTSAQGYYKIIDVSVRFTNKTTTALSFAYASGSGMATDDRGNRYAVGGANGSRGIGLVSGNSFDPKMVVRPGGYADARFELLFAPGQAVLGLTYELDLTVNELNAVEGNQYTLGGEFPLQFKNLTNGSVGSAPGPVTYSSAGSVASAAPPCGPAGTAQSVASATSSAGVQNATNTAATAVNNTSNAISSIGSMFGKKKPAASTAASTAAPAPCSPASSTAAPAPAPAPAASAAVAAPATRGVPVTTAAAKPAAKPTVVAPAATVMKAPATTTVAAKTPTPATTTAAKAPVPATTATPIKGQASTSTATASTTTNGAVSTTPPKSQTP